MTRGPRQARLYERTIEHAERDAEIARYKARTGGTYRQVAEHFNIGTSTVTDSLRRAIQAAAAPAGREYIAAELIKLDMLEAAALEVLNANHNHVSDGRVVKDDGVLITDHKPILMAIDRLLRIAERRSRLLGLDMPTRTEVTVLTKSVVEQAILDLEAELAEGDGDRSVDRGPQASQRPAGQDQR